MNDNTIDCYYPGARSFLVNNMVLVAHRNDGHSLGWKICKKKALTQKVPKIRVDFSFYYFNHSRVPVRWTFRPRCFVGRWFALSGGTSDIVLSHNLYNGEAKDALPRIN
jgi:hypothetical protein